MIALLKSASVQYGRRRNWRRLLRSIGRLAGPADRFRGEPATDSDREAAATAGEGAESARIDALRALRLIEQEPGSNFDRIMESSRAIFETKFAAVTLVDDEHQWIWAAAGLPEGVMPREQSFCQFTISEARANVIGNTRNDARTRHLTPTTELGIGFYAGFPLRAPTGHVVGALCVFDPEPRDASRVDTVLLRSLAMAAEQELWATAEHAASPSALAAGNG